MRAWLLALLLAAVAAPGSPPAQGQRASPAAPASVAIENLPREARETIELIRKGGPFAHKRDGMVFSNREGRLPSRKRGYYREYTVRTPGERTRGARRIVAGAEGELYYTDDHYTTFRRVRD